MTEQTDVMKELGLEVMTDEQLLWKKVKENSEMIVKQSQEAEKVHGEIIKLADQKIKDAGA